MVVELCRARGVPVYILWQNNVVERMVPACHNDITRLALHIRGDHAYFYEDSYTKKWIARHASVTIPAAQAREKMKTLPKVPETHIEDWAPLGAVTEDLEGDYYAVGEAEMLAAAPRFTTCESAPRCGSAGPVSRTFGPSS